ncbi:MAG: hypothetical protein ACFFDI_19270 [Promethearchaeota archaeon]
MVKITVLHSQEPQLNASLIVTLISPILLQDYELQEDGLYCYFTRPISHLQALIKSLLAALYEITNKQFYFEIINDQEAILRIYGLDGLQFSQDVMFKSSVSKQGRS